MATANEIVQKVHKLWGLSQSSNPNEAAAAMAAAARLMLEYQLTEAEVRKAQADVAYVERPVLTRQRMPNWMTRLLALVASETGCVVVRSGVHTRLITWLLVGSDANTSFAHALYAHGMLTISRLAARDCRGLGKRASTSYCIGAVEGVRQKLAEARTSAMQGASTQAITLVTSESDRVNAFLDSRGTTKTARCRRPKVDRAAYLKGVQEGRQIRLHAKDLPEGGA